MTEPRQHTELPGGTKYLVNQTGVWWVFPGSGERLAVHQAEEIQRLFLAFRQPGRVRLNDSGLILAFRSELEPTLDPDPDDDAEFSGHERDGSWWVIGDIYADLQGQFPFIPELPADPARYETEDLWKGPYDGVRYSMSGDARRIFRGWAGSRRWSVNTRESGLSDEVLGRLATLKPDGGRFVISEQGAIVALVDPELIPARTMSEFENLGAEQQRYLHFRIENTRLVPLFLGRHTGGIELEPSRSIHDPLNSAEFASLQRLLGLPVAGGKES